jgi:putative DNA primase/helicase
MSGLPKFKDYCEAACRKLWGAPNHSTPRELRWNGADAYSAKTFNRSNKLWFDHGAGWGGGLLDLLAHEAGEPKRRDLKGPAFYEAWRKAHELGLVPDAPPEKPNGKGNGAWLPIRAIYPYQDETHAVLYEVVRFDTEVRDRRFKQRRPDGNGGWIWSIKGVRRVPYRLPELIDAVKAGQRILICEGERDANTAVSLDFAATTMPGGIDKWRDEYDQFLVGVDVVVVSDNDPQAREEAKEDGQPSELLWHPDGRPKLPGQDHAAKVAERLRKVAARVRIIIFPQKDLTAWREADGTRDALEELIARAPDYAPVPASPVPEVAGPPALVLPPPSAPVLVVRAFVEHNGKRDGVSTIAYWSQSWWTWRKTHWTETDPDAVRKLLYDFTADAKFADSHGNLTPWSPNRLKISDLVDALKAEVALPDDIEPPAWLDRRATGTIVAVSNGLLDVSTRALVPHTPLYFGHVSVPFPYDPNAPPPTKWLAFLRSIWPDDQAAVDADQEWFGYVISGRTDLQKILVTVGPTRGGKGVIARVLTALLGKRNVCGPTLSSLAETFGLQPMIGKSLAIISDARSGAGNRSAVSTTATERMLSISGEDRLDVRRMHRMQYTGKLTVRLHVISNELPRFNDPSGAIIGRLVVLMTKQSWLGRENHELENELQPELPSILIWALGGLSRLAANGGKFTRAASAEEAVRDMLDMASPVGAFVRERCKLDLKAEIATDTLYSEFGFWCEHEGHPKLDAAHFGRDLKAAFPSVNKVRKRSSGRAAFYTGIRLLRDDEVV